TVRQREVRARGPGPAGQLPFTPGVGALELFLSKCQSFLALHQVTCQRTAYCVLNRVHYVQIKEAVEEAYVQRGHRIRGHQAHRPGVHELQVLDDDAGLDNVALAVDEHRELAQRPAPQPLGRVPRRVRPEAAELEGRAVLV